MAEFCTCGAELPADARFCHKCGKPQREEPHVEAVPHAADWPAILPADALPTSVLPPPPSFHNPVAVRTALLAASLAALFSVLLFYGLVIWLLAAGFLSVYLFGRRTGQFLNIRGGARMGWITGVLNFVIMTILFTVATVSISGQGGIAAYYREMAGKDPNVEQAVRMLETPSGMAMAFVFSLILLFVIIVLLCTAGGVLGAKVLDKE